MTDAPLLHAGPLLHHGWVHHVRHAPFVHRFRYRIWMLSVDLGAMPGGRLLGHDRAALVSLRNRDHGPRDGGALLPWAQAELARAGLPEAARIRFMCIPRVLGFAFNPIAFFFCHDAAGRLQAVIHQVKNTFGGQVTYVLPVDDGAAIRQQAAKAMHVSPFFDTSGGYRFAFARPDFAALGPFDIAIRYGAEDGPRMTASMALATTAASPSALLRLLAAMPLMPLKVVAAIHWEALRLWLRGARFHPAPAPASATIPRPSPGEHA